MTDSHKDQQTPSQSSPPDGTAASHADSSPPGTGRALATTRTSAPDPNRPISMYENTYYFNNMARGPLSRNPREARTQIRELTAQMYRRSGAAEPLNEDPEVQDKQLHAWQAQTYKDNGGTEPLSEDRDSAISQMRQQELKLQREGWSPKDGSRWNLHERISRRG